MAKIPSFFLGGDIPKAAVGDVLEAMYLAGGTSFNIKPLLPEPRNGAVPALPPPGTRSGSVAARVHAYVDSQSEPFTMNEMCEALHFNQAQKNSAYHAIHHLKKLKRVRAGVRKGHHCYIASKRRAARG